MPRLLLAAVVSCCAAPAPAGSACSPDLSFITPLIEQYLSTRPALQGMGVSVGSAGETWYEQYFRSYTPATVIPIASASKWPTSTLIMTLVEDGLLTLDDTVATYLPEFNIPGLSAITIGQCLSHTSGLPGESSAISSTSITLRQAAQLIAAEGPRTGADGQPVVPGTDFCYGGVSMHVAGAVAEVVTGMPYPQLLEQRITTPLGMTSTTFAPGTLANPRIAGGLRSGLTDYRRFLAMLLRRGDVGGSPLLSPLSVATIVDDRVGGLPATCIPPTAEGPAYGIGCWIESVGPGGFSNEVSSPGAFGFNPWIDVRRNYLGIVMIQGQNADVTPLVQQIQAGVRERLDAFRRGFGDANADGRINGADLSITLGQFGKTVTPDTGADYNGDGVVNSADLSILLASFGNQC